MCNTFSPLHPAQLPSLSPLPRCLLLWSLQNDLTLCVAYHFFRSATLIHSEGRPERTISVMTFMHIGSLLNSYIDFIKSRWI